MRDAFALRKFEEGFRLELPHQDETAASVKKRNHDAAQPRDMGCRDCERRGFLAVQAEYSNQWIEESITPRCVSAAPFGLPVVPEVYRMPNTSSSPAAQAGSASPWSSRQE